MSGFIQWKSWLALFLCLFLTSCASLESDKLKPGQDGEAQVEGVLGKAAMRWQNNDGSIQLAYPNQEHGRTLMVTLGINGKLQSVRNSLDSSSFSRIQAGMTKEQVILILGPSDPTLTIHFQRRNELTWGWTFQEIGEPAYFFVLFDAGTGTVRSTMIAPLRVIIDLS